MKGAAHSFFELIFRLTYLANMAEAPRLDSDLTA